MVVAVDAVVVIFAKGVWCSVIGDQNSFKFLGCFITMYEN